MGVKILENASFGILRTNPKITGNVKVVVDSSSNTFIESIDANDELARSKYKAIKTSAASSYQFDLARVFGNTPSDIFYDVKKPSSDYSVLDNYGLQYDLDYCYGSYSVNSKSYKEEFGIFAPIWLENNLPDYFIIFRVDGPVTVNNLNATTENENGPIVDNPLNFKDLFLSKSKIIKTFDLRNSTNIGKYIRNYKSADGFPLSALNFSNRSDQGTYWSGVSIDKPGGFTSKSENIYNTFFTTDRTILENDFFITTGFERNRLTCANIINFEFLFDDPESNSFEINRYFGIYVNAEIEGTFRLSGPKAYYRSQKDKQTKPKNEIEFSSNNELSKIIENDKGVKLYVDDNFINIEYELDPNSGLTNLDFLPSSNEVQALNSIFFVKDKLGNFHNLNYSEPWLNDEIRLQDKTIDISNFTGFEETILTAYGRVPNKSSKSSTFIEVLQAPPNGDSYVVTLPKKQTYLIDVISALAGDTVTIQNGDATSSITFTLSSSNIQNALTDIKTNIDNSTDPLFQKYVTSIRNGILILSEKDFTCSDDNFTLTAPSSDIIITKQVSADLTEFIISADSTISIPGTAEGLSFSTLGTNAEIAKAMSLAINNIKERLFEAVSVDNKVVIIAKVAGPRFNDLVIGRNTFMTGPWMKLITDIQAPINNPDYTFYNFQGGTNNPESKTIVDIDLFTQFGQPNRYLRTQNDKNVAETITKIKSVFYYTDEEIRDRNGILIGFKNFDKYCVVAIEDKYKIFRDSSGAVYLYELYDIPFGRFSVFPIKNMDTDFLSTEYGNEKELNLEKDYYSTFGVNPLYTHEDIENFYQKTGFTTLLNMLASEVESFSKGQDSIPSPNIECEYERLKENELTETSVPSRTVPYINKWVYRNGKNVRESDYRLTFSESFGLTNFAPIDDEKDRNPEYFTHEWYYLQKLPKFYGLYDTSYLDSVFSYFPDNIDDSITGLQNINTDYFTEYFTVDYLNHPVMYMDSAVPEIQPFTVESEVPYGVNKQFRYTVFEGGNGQNFASTLFRGVKVVVKERVESQIVVNYDISSIKTKYSNRFNDYKFSCVLIPHNGTYNGIQRKTIEYEFIENRKYKNITFLIYLKIDDIMCSSTYYNDLNSSFNTITTDFIDRTLLYALNSKLITVDTAAINPSNNYADIVLSGSIRATSPESVINLGSGSSYLKGVPNAVGQNTLFTEEVLINKSGGYNNLIVEPGASITKTYAVSSVIDNNRIGVIDTSPPLPFPYLYSSLTDFAVQTGSYTYQNGGYGFWSNRLNKVSFGYIYDLVNQGDPAIRYKTIMEDGTVQQNMFLIELQTPNYTLKSSYLKPYQVSNQSNVTNDLSTVIGYQLQFGEDSKIIPIYRHIGYYQPKFIDVVNFIDPYVTNLDLTITDKNYYIKQKMRDKNTQFKLDGNFGYIDNLYLHKVNDVNPSSIIQLSENSSFLPVYPLSGQIAIDYKDFYTFKTNWDADYFQKFFEKGTKTNIVGTRSTIEKRSFFGSKVMKIEDVVTVETFNATRVNTEDELNTIGSEILKQENPYEVAYYEDANKFIIDVYLEKRLVQVISDLGVYDFFAKYINPAYGFGSEDGITDDVFGYIQSNIVPRYILGKLNLYVIKSGDVNLNQTYPAINTSLNDAQKILSNYKLDNNVQFTYLPGISNFNLRLIYNKTAGYNYSIAPSFRVDKK